MKLITISVITTTANVETQFSVLTLLLTKLQNTSAPNSLDNRPPRRFPSQILRNLGPFFAKI